MPPLGPPPRESQVTHEARDYRLPNLLEDDNEVLVAGRNSLQQRRNASSDLSTAHTSPLQHNAVSRTADVGSLRTQQSDPTPQTIAELADALQRRATLRASCPPTYRPQRSSPQGLPAYTRQEPLLRAQQSYPAPSGNSRVVIAIDYGTTYTGFALAETQFDYAELNKIEVLQNWGYSGNNQSKVRTMISYVKSFDGEIEWGSNVSDHSTAMVNTKLELEPQPTRYDELELTLYLLRGTGNLRFDHLKNIGPSPAYTSAPPKQIVQDYLERICKNACRPDSFEKIDMTRLAETNTPLDIVVTVPANWSSQATDATFKAIQGAGFNRSTFPTLKDTILVSEPEAAAFFAIRDHQSSSHVDLRVKDCFIVCDAGGGTVDVVSLQVKKVTPQLELERATEPQSKKCGSAFIDTKFKTWLREVLGVEDYGKLDPLNARGRITAHTLESGPIRTLVEKFIKKKQTFSSSSDEIKIDLPEPLNDLNIEGRVFQGELTIYPDEMADLFSESVNGVIELLDDQMYRLRKAKKPKSRNVFLVGGFGASPYLQEQLMESLDELRGSTLRRPESEKSLTAVVQGAIIYGVEKSRHSCVKYMSAITQSYGIAINGRFEWLIRNGDLLLSTEKKQVYSKSFYIPLKACPMRKYELAIYRYSKRHENDDDVPEFWDDGQHEVEKAAVLNCDLSAMLERDTRIHSAFEVQRNLQIGPFRCCLQLSNNCLEVEVLQWKIIIARREIELKPEGDSNVAENDWN